MSLKWVFLLLALAAIMQVLSVITSGTVINAEDLQFINLASQPNVLHSSSGAITGVFDTFYLASSVWSMLFNALAWNYPFFEASFFGRMIQFFFIAMSAAITFGLIQGLVRGTST